MKSYIDQEYALNLLKRVQKLKKEIGKRPESFHTMAKNKITYFPELFKRKRDPKKEKEVEKIVKLLVKHSGKKYPEEVPDDTLTSRRKETEKVKRSDEEIMKFLLYDDIRPEGVGFDINRFLVVFDKIHLKKDVVLDYAYDFIDSDARPYIYTRYKDEPKITPYRYHELFGHDVKPYLKDIVIEKDSKSFFQLTVFSVVINQFYLRWPLLLCIIIIGKNGETIYIYGLYN